MRPLYWARAGERNADRKIRKGVAKAGGASSTVGHVNSLRGACLVQGVLSAVALAEKWPEIAITESHPKALLAVWPDAAEFVKPFGFSTDHERDAALGAYAAFALSSQWPQWPQWMDWMGLEEKLLSAVRRESCVLVSSCMKSDRCATRLAGASHIDQNAEFAKTAENGKK